MKNTLSLMAFFIAIFCSQQSMAELANEGAILGIWLNAQQDGFIKMQIISTVSLLEVQILKMQTG